MDKQITKVHFHIAINEVKLIGQILSNDIVMFHRLDINNLIKKNLIRDFYIIKNILAKSEIKELNERTI